MQATKQVREYLGHNGYECRVRISRTGDVTRYGSPDSSDRAHDYWHDMGTVFKILQQIDREKARAFTR